MDQFDIVYTFELTLKQRQPHNGLASPKQHGSHWDSVWLSWFCPIIYSLK